MAKQQKKATTKPKAAVQEQPNEQDLLSTRQACEYLGVSRPTLLRLAKKHKWKVYQVYTVNGSENRYQRAELAEYSQRDVKREQVVLGGINALQRGQVSAGIAEILQSVERLASAQEAQAAAQQKANDIAEQQTAELRRANDLQERRLEWEMQQTPARNAVASPLGLEQGQPADTSSVLTGQAPNARTPTQGPRTFLVHLLGAVQRILEG